MSEWKCKKLKEIISFQRKGITPAYAEKGKGTVLVLNQKCNRDYSINTEEAQYNDIAKKKVSLDLLLQPGDVLINSTGKGTLGRVAQYRGSDYPATVDSHMLIIRPTEEIDAIFFGYAIKQFQSILMTKGIGSSGQEELDKLSLNEIKISYPSDLKLQKKVAQILSSLDKKIELNRRLNDNLESMAQALYDYWFVQFDFPDENGKPYKSSGGRMVWNDKLKREIPEGWIIEPLENLCERITKGTTPSTLGFQFTDAGINFVKVESLTDKHIIDTKQLSYICENAHEALKRSQLKQFDLLFSIAGSIGRFAIVDEDILPANTNQAVAIIRCDRTQIHPYYVYATLLGDLHSSHCSQNVEKVCQANLSLGALSKMPILRCGTQLEELFLSRITPIIDRSQRLGVEQRKLTEQRDFLLPLLMNGQVQVKPLNYRLADD